MCPAAWDQSLERIWIQGLSRKLPACAEEVFPGIKARVDIFGRRVTRLDPRGLGGPSLCRFVQFGIPGARHSHG